LDARAARQPGLAGATNDLLVGERVDSYGILQKAPEQQASMTRTATVETEGELIQVVVDVVEAGRTLMSPEQPAFEKGDHQMDTRQKLCGSLLSAPTQDDWLVIVAGHPEVRVAEVAIGVDQAAALDHCFDEALHAARGTVVKALHPNSSHAPATLFNRDHDLRLGGGLTAEDAGLHASDPSLIDFNRSFQEVAVRPDHGMSQFVEPGPGGPIAAQAENLLDSHGAGALLLSGDQPDGVEPEPKRLVGVLKNGPGSDRGLVPTLGALEEPGSTGLPSPVTRALGTDEAVGPAQLGEVIPAARLGGEAVSELGKGARIVVDAGRLC
jgi:hypothetical protein